MHLPVPYTLALALKWLNNLESCVPIPGGWALLSLSARSSLTHEGQVFSQASLTYMDIKGFSLPPFLPSFFAFAKMSLNSWI